MSAFTGVKDASLKAILERFADSLRPRNPFGRTQFVDVTFPGAGTDVDIAHTLNPLDPESVRWLPVTRSAGVVIYQDQSASRKAWQPTTIWLRASGAATARLLLFLESTTNA